MRKYIIWLKSWLPRFYGKNTTMQRLKSLILLGKVDSKKDTLTPEQINECVKNWNDYSLEEKKEIAHLFIKVVTITDYEIQIIF